MTVPANAIIVNQGRDALITYLRNSNADPQENKFYFSYFVLLTGISGDPVVEKVWDETSSGYDLFPHMIEGTLSSTPTIAKFEIPNRSQISGRKLRFTCSVPSGFSTDDSDITGLAILYTTEDSETGLFAYGTMSGENKISGTDLTMYLDCQF